MDSAHCLRFFRDLAALQAIQEALAAGRRNTLVMVVDDNRGSPSRYVKTYLDCSELLPGGGTLFSWCAATPQSLDWRDAILDA